MTGRGSPPDGTSGGRAVRRRPGRLARTVLVAAVLGVVGGLVTVAFIRILDWILDRLWTSLPDALGVSSGDWYYVVPVVVVGAVLLGLARARLGEYPVSLEEAVEHHRRDGEFDRHHIWQGVVISFISLGFGAALGPEAALMSLLGGIGSWVARVIDADTAEGTDIAFVGISGALGALFGTAGTAALVLDRRDTDVGDARSGRLWRIVPGLAAALAGLWIYRALGTSDSYFDLGLPDYTFALGDLGWAVLVAAAGAVAGLVFLALCRLAERLVAPVAHRPVVLSVIGGLGLALLACWSTLVLFSGHQGVDTLIREYGDDSVRFLVLVALAKAAAAALLLGTRWKGGRFFPLMFVGAAIGVAASQLGGGFAEVPAIAAGMTAVVAVLLRRPLLAVVFMILFFPPTAWPVVVLAAVLGSVVGRRLGSRIEEGA